jgi:hypothetical protein
VSDAESLGAKLSESLRKSRFTVEQVLAEKVGNGFVSGVVARPVP